MGRMATYTQRSSSVVTDKNNADSDFDENQINDTSISH